MPNDERTYAIVMDCPHPTAPSVVLHVRLHDEVGRVASVDAPAVVWGIRQRFCLLVPPLETWTLETVRLVLHELSAYTPVDPEASAGITARLTRRGRGSRLHPDVRLWVSGRGWRAEISTERNEAMRVALDGAYIWAGELPGKWTAPMQAVLLDLAGRSPFRLAAVTEVLPGDPAEVDCPYVSRWGLTQGLYEIGNSDAGGAGGGGDS